MTQNDQRRGVGRPKQPVVEREAAVRIALQIIDVDGLEQLSMRRLARHMGVDIGALYHHFRDKNDLLDEVAFLALRKIPFPDVSEPWPDLIVRAASAYRSALLRHPNALPLLIRAGRRITTTDAYAVYEEFLVGQGLSAETARFVIESMELLIVGSAAIQFSEKSSGADDGSMLDVRFEKAARCLVRGLVCASESEVKNSSSRRKNATVKPRSHRPH